MLGTSDTPTSLAGPLRIMLLISITMWRTVAHVFVANCLAAWHLLYRIIGRPTKLIEHVVPSCHMQCAAAVMCSATRPGGAVTLTDDATDRDLQFRPRHSSVNSLCYSLRTT